MNARSIVLIFAVALLGIGLVMTIAGLLKPEQPAPRISVAHAAQQIEPYTVIEQNMLEVEEMRASDARDLGAWPANDVVGKMATKLIKPNEVLGTNNALPIEDYRIWPDLGMELVSFSASADRAVAGNLQPGQLINLYGYNSGSPEDQMTVLIEPGIRVVKVQAGGGAPAGSGTPVANWEQDSVTFSNQDQPKTGTLLTVAVTPEQSVHIIDSLGAQGLAPYVTLAGTRTAAVPTPGLSGQAAAQPTQPAIDIDATMTAIWGSINAQATAGAPPTGGGGASR